MTRKKMTVISAIVFILSFGFMTMPFTTKFINKIEPHILGLPCFQFFIVASCVFFCLYLIFWYKMDVYLEDKEIRERTEKEGVNPDDK